MSDRRAFIPAAPLISSLPRIRARVGEGGLFWRYTVLLPVDETRAGQETRTIATPHDQDTLEQALANCFDGVTVLHPTRGCGLRAGEIELNTNIPYVVIAAPVTETEQYFLGLKKELQEALNQETILIQRQDVWIL